METRVYRFCLEPISFNNAYPTSFRGGHRFLSPEGKEYKAMIKEIMETDDWRRYGSKFSAEYVEMTVVYLLPHSRDRGKGLALFYKNGNPRRVDVTNFFKLMEDAVASYLGIDDDRNISVHGYKRLNPEDRCEMVMYLSPADLRNEIYHGGQLVWP